MKRLTQELGLSATQQAAVEPIVARAYVELLRLRVSHQPDVDRVLDLGIQELKATLSPEQQVKLDGLHAQLQQRWRMTREYVRQAQDAGGRKE